MIALNVLYAEKEKNISCLCFKTIKSVKKSYYFNYSKWRRMPLSRNKKSISTIMRNNIKK